jgi:hypothetical protein
MYLCIYQTNPAEKVAAAQLLSYGPATSSEAVTKEIHHTTTSKYAKELRDQLFQNEKGKATVTIKAVTEVACNNSQYKTY